MRKLVLALAATTLMAGAAFAGSIDGVVKEVNKDKNVIMLEDGTSIDVPQGVPLPPEIAVGSKIAVVTDDNTNLVTSITMRP